MSVTWNGTTISGPVLIYQDELVVDTRTTVTGAPIDGTLECRSEDQARAGWHFQGGSPVLTTSTSGDVRQIRTPSQVTPSVSRLTVNREDLRRIDDFTNGLWTCRLNRNRVSPTPVPVGIYARAGGEDYNYYYTIQKVSKQKLRRIAEVF